MNALYLANTECKYTIIQASGQHVTIKATAFLLWCGFHEFFNVYYPGWLSVGYCFPEASGTIHNRQRYHV
jgi:hypothetical protein